MSELIRRLKKRYDLTVNNWRSDVHFSRKYAMMRLADDFSGRLGFSGLSDKVHDKKEAYMLDYLERTLSPVIAEYKNCTNKGIIGGGMAPIWVCWWTGEESAPELVRQCIRSIRQNAGRHPVRLITQENFQEYVEIPNSIFSKMQNGQMKLAHFCDYLRVCLLCQYGGLWLDATIYCSSSIPEEYFEAPFFTCKSPYRECRYLSKFQWCTFCLGGWRESVIFSFLRKAFETYWEQNEAAIDYLFFDALFYLARKHVPQIKALMDAVPENTPRRDDLQAAMNAALPAEEFDRIVCSDTALYKLSWRETYSPTTKDGQESVYGYFLKKQ